MDVDTAFLSVIISILITKLSNYLASSGSGGTNSYLVEWKEMLVDIKHVIGDAEKKRMGQLAVELWLQRVQDVGHDIDDVLDDLSLQNESYASTKKVSKIIPKTCRRFFHGSNKITVKLQDLVEKKNSLGLIENVGRRNRTSERPVVFPPSPLDDSIIVGREKDTKALLDKLVGDQVCKQKVGSGVVSIVGMGGIGKTTLAKTLYYHDEVVEHFDIRAWVSLSFTDEFNVFEISQAIIQALGAQHVQDSADLNLLQAALKETFINQRFLLVIDNVWNVKSTEWELFKVPFALAAPGSKFIVTTQNVTVASATDSVEAYRLEVLSNEEALSLFAQNALGEPTFDSYPTRKLHVEGIVKKCDGCPLALVSIGKMLRTQKSDQAWKELSTNHWKLKLRGNSKILPTLRLSYNDLPPHLKPMFAFCSLFPKDYVFGKKELILMWMALGFLYYSDTKKSPEHLGGECFEELESKCFFQIKKSSEYIMNHLINDLATCVGERHFYRLDDQMDTKKDLEKVHHFSFTHQRFGVYTKFKELQKNRRLQTFLAVSDSLLLNNILVELLPQLQSLRVLSLTSYSITELPQCIGSLKHMCYLNCSQTNITYLPEQVADLYNLQSLLLRGCRKLVSLPNSFGKLINLRHLDISDTPRLKKIPMGIERLTDLQTLSKVIIKKADGFKLSDLQSLHNLQGHLSIEGLQKVKDVKQAKDANLQEKKGLDVLELEWSDAIGDPRNEKTESSVLEELRPHPELRILKILFYSGEQFPSWIGDPSFVLLKEISLSGCRSCTDFPTLGHLGSLKKLFVESMDEVKNIRFDLLGPANSSHVNVFPSLEVLEFRDMHGWKEWSIHGSDKDGATTLFPSLRKIYVANCPNLAEVSFGSAFPSLEILEFKNMQGWKKWSGTTASFPHLRQMSLVNCLNLDVVSIKSMPSLQHLHIQKCSIAVLSHMVGLSSSIVSLMVENIKELTHLPKEVLEHLGEVKDLCIKWCDQMTCLWDSESEACNFLVRLQKLEVFYCKKLVSLSEKGLNLDSSMKSVKEVYICDCEKLKNYDCPKSIERLVIWNCSSLTSLTFPTVEETSSTLKFLDIQRCYNLEENWLLDNFLSPLESLVMVGLPNLRCFPGEYFLHITKLIIRACDNIESINENGFGSIPLRYLEIIHCKKLKSFPHQQLPSLTSLEELVISHCLEMDDKFPCRSWPPKLSILTIGGLKKPMSEWGTQNFPSSLRTLYLHGQNSGAVPFAETDSNNSLGSSVSGRSTSFGHASITKWGTQNFPSSLRTLYLHGQNSGAVPFAETDSNNVSPFYLPPTLTFLEINGFIHLKSLSKGLQHLDSLERLVIDACPKLVDLPETLLPKLLSLKVYYCPKLQEKCHSTNGNYRHILSQLPELYV